MKRILGQLVCTAVFALVASAAAPACVTNDQSIFVRAVLAPSANRQNGICTWTDDPSQASLFEGHLDVGIRDSYVGVLLIGNQMIPRGDPAQVRAESNRVHINGAVVKVTYPDGEVIGEFTSTGNGFADPQANNVADFGLAQITLIDAPTAARISERVPMRGDSRLVVATAKAFGQTLGGVDVESGEFQFPIRVCAGCFILPDSDGDACDKPIDATGGGANELPCVVGQEEFTPCQLCRGKWLCDDTRNMTLVPVP